MRWVSNYKHPQQLHFIISRDKTAGYYVNVYSVARFFSDDLKDPAHANKNYQDKFCQDTLEQAKEFSSRKFGVPADAWEEIK